MWSHILFGNSGVKRLQNRDTEQMLVVLALALNDKDRMSIVPLNANEIEIRREASSNFRAFTTVYTRMGMDSPRMYRVRVWDRAQILNPEYMDSESVLEYLLRLNEYSYLYESTHYYPASDSVLKNPGGTIVLARTLSDRTYVEIKPL